MSIDWSRYKSSVKIERLRTFIIVDANSWGSNKIQWVQFSQFTISCTENLWVQCKFLEPQGVHSNPLSLWHCRPCKEKYTYRVWTIFRCLQLNAVYKFKLKNTQNKYKNKMPTAPPFKNSVSKQALGRAFGPWNKCKNKFAQTSIGKACTLIYRIRMLKSIR